MIKRNQLTKELPAILERCKYPALILLLGLALVLWPDRGAEVQPEPAVTETEAQSDEDPAGTYRARTERELAELLSLIEGAGEVRVMLTLKSGPSTRYLTDRTAVQNREGERESLSTEERAVIFDRGSAYDEPAVVSTAYPVFQGALIVAEGGADPVVRCALSAAVAALLDLGADQITVVKMK